MSEIAHDNDEPQKVVIIKHRWSMMIFENGGFIMSKNKNAYPQSKQAMDQFKYEVANEIGVPLKQGYNGDLTSAQNGYVGGYMVKKMIERAEQDMSNKSQF